MDENLEIKEKFRKRTAYEVWDYAVHFGICGKRKGTRPALPFICDVVWSCSVVREKLCTGRGRQSVKLC